MDNANNYPSCDLGDCTPDQQQTWLLHAAVSSGDQAIESWHRWRDEIDLDSVDSASFRLLPLAYRNMTALGQDDALLRRLKGVYRHTWYRNQILFRRTRELLASFEQAGISVMMLKGAALVDRFYQDDGKRFMDDVDLMVANDDFPNAANMMLEQGWKPTLYSSDTMAWYHRHRFKHGCAFEKQKVEIDLHSQLMRFTPQSDAALWNASIKQDWRGHPVYFLNDTQQLFHTCVYGVRWSHGFLSWIPDALKILESVAPGISWQDLVETARHTRTMLYLRNALAYLAQEFQAPIPAEVIRALDEIPVSWIERGEHRVMTHMRKGGRLGEWQRVLFQSCKYHWAKVPEPEPIGLSWTAWIEFLVIHAYPPGWWQSRNRRKEEK